MTQRVQALRGLRVLVTRAQRQADSLKELLEKRGAEVQEIPFIDMLPPDSWEALDGSLRDILEYDWLVLTSVNGVNAFFDRVQHLGMIIDELQHLKIAAIGPATEQAISDHGLVVDVVPQRYVAEEVVKALRGRIMKRDRVLLVRASIARDVIPVELTGMGAKVDVREAYQTILPEGSKQRLLELLTSELRPDVITFTSSSTVENLMKMAVGSEIPKKLAGINFAAIGPVTAATLKSYGLPVHIEAEDYTMAGLMNAIEQFYTQPVH
ncbi:MAG: uroporphyrinogen-III synthase [Acidobacteriaceae bacterium]